MDRLVLHNLKLMLVELLDANREYIHAVYFCNGTIQTLIPSTNTLIGTTTYICRMVFRCMSCQFHSQKVNRCQTDKVMTCAAFVQMVVSFSFVIPVQELFTEVMTLCIPIACMRCFVFAYCSIKLHLTLSLRYAYVEIYVLKYK